MYYEEAIQTQGSQAWEVPSGPLLQHTHYSNMRDKGIQDKMLDTIRELSGISGNYADYENNLKYRMWDTFVLIFDYFMDNMKRFIVTLE